jgi:hypothetical protein
MTMGVLMQGHTFSPILQRTPALSLQLPNKSKISGLDTSLLHLPTADKNLAWRVMRQAKSAIAPAAQRAPMDGGKAAILIALAANPAFSAPMRAIGTLAENLIGQRNAASKAM